MMAVGVSPNGKNHYETSAPTSHRCWTNPVRRKGPSPGLIRGLTSRRVGQDAVLLPIKVVEDGLLARVVEVDAASGDANAAIARTRDAGRTWEYLAGGLPGHIRGNIEAMTMNLFPGGFELFAGTTDGDVFFSDNEGDTWTTIGESLPPLSKGGHYRPLRPDLVPAGL